MMGGANSRNNNYVWFAVTAILVVGIVLLNAVERIGASTSIGSSVVPGIRPEPVNPIYQISILGERNSGTRWLYEYVPVV